MASISVFAGLLRLAAAGMIALGQAAAAPRPATEWVAFGRKPRISGFTWNHGRQRSLWRSTYRTARPGL